MRYQYVLLRKYAALLKRVSALVVVLLFAVTAARGQYDVSFSHYFDMEPSFNPAAVGKGQLVNITAAYAMDLAGFEHNPNTMYVAADMPFYFLNMYHGGGVSIMSDKIGLFAHQRVALQYALKRDLLGGVLSVGAQLGFLSEKLRVRPWSGAVLYPRVMVCGRVGAARHGTAGGTGRAQ